MTGQHHAVFLIPANDQTPIVLTGFGHTPEVVIARWNGRTEIIDSVGRADSRRGLGAAIDSTAAGQSNFTHLMVDGAPASNTLGGAFPGSLISLVKSTGPVPSPFSDGSARVASIDEDGITLDITTAFSIPILVGILSLGPELVTDKALGFEDFPAAVGPQAIIGLGFQPSALILSSAGRFESEPNFSQFCIGFAADDGASGVDQSLLVGYSRGNGQSSDTRRYCRRDYSLGLSTEVPGNDLLERRASVTSFDSDGFTLDHDTVFAVAKKYAYLALDGPGFRAGSFKVGQEATSGLPFVPRGGLFLSAGQIESLDTLDMQVDDQSMMGLAAINADGLDQSSGATRSDDGQTFMTIATRIQLSSVLGGIDDLGAEPLGVADGDTLLGPMRNDGFDIQTPDPWLGGDVYVGYLTFGAPQPIVTDSRLAIVPAGSQDPPVATFTKDPGSTLDYAMNWDAPLSDETPAVQDSITKSTWTITGAPPSLAIDESPPSSFTGNETRVWISGGAAGKRYDVVNRIETLDGRVYERTIQIQVEER